jgi:hypothetical protein
MSTAMTRTPIAAGVITPGLPPSAHFSRFSVRYGLPHKKTIMVNMA